MRELLYDMTLINNDHLIRLEDISRIYQETPFSGVRDVSFTIRQGGITVIAGESGSGKSTLLKLITGLMSPDKGTVWYKDEKVAGPENKLIPGHDAMKVVSQDFNLNVYAKVYDNIAGLLPNTDLKGKQQKTFEVMEFLRIDHLAGKRAVDLSGGEQQRVAIARAIVTEPEILLMDEPFSQIDAILKNDLRADIKRMSQYLGLTIILVSHDPLDGLSLADDMVILKNGKVLEQGSPRALYHHPGYLYTSQLLANCNVLTSEDASLIGISTQKDHVVIYPEWITFHPATEDNVFTLRDRFFKGSYDEILLEKNGVKIRAMYTGTDTYAKNDSIPVNIERHLEF